MIDVPPQWVLDAAEKIVGRQRFFDFLCNYYAIQNVIIVADSSQVPAGKQGNYVSRAPIHFHPFMASVIYLKSDSLDPWVVRHEFAHHLQYCLSGGHHYYNEDFANAWADELTKRLSQRG